MKKNLFLLLPLLLVSCKAVPGGSGITLEERLQNPLFAEIYYDILLDRMVELDIQDDPILKDADKAKIVEDTRRDALAKAKAANTKQREGMMGNFISVAEETKGEALFVDATLYVGPTFESNPGPSVHVLLTTVVDPREGTFPDETSIDLGPLESPFGSQAMAVPPMEDASKYRTVVLWDTKLERIHGFAQMSR